MGRRPHCILLAATIIILLGTAAARAEEVNFSLSDCLRRALDASLEVRSGRYLTPIAQTGITEAESEFDHLLSFRASGGKSITPAASFFAGATELKEQTFAGGLEVGQKVRTGGYYAFGIQTNDLVTNSQFYNFRPLWTSGLTFRFEQPLLRSAGVTYNEIQIRLAEKNLTAAEANYRGVLERTMAEVELAYWNLVFLREDYEVKQYSLRVAEELLDISRRRLAAGAGTRVELIQAEAGVADRETQLILAEQAIRGGEDALRAYVFPFAEDTLAEIRIVPTDTVTGELPKIDEELARRLRTAFDFRPDVIAARARLESAGIRVVQKENELLPRLDVFGSLGYSGLEDTLEGSTGDVWRFEYPAWQIGLTLEIPLGNRGARSRYRRALLERSQSIAEFESLRNRVIVDVRSALRVIETARRGIAATEKANAAAEAQFEAEKVRLAADRSTNYFLLQKQSDLTEAQTSVLLAYVTYRRALVGLEAASGTYLAARGLLAPPPKDEPEEPEDD